MTVGSAEAVPTSYFTLGGLKNFRRELLSAFSDPAPDRGGPLFSFVAFLQMLAFR